MLELASPANEYPKAIQQVGGPLPFLLLDKAGSMIEDPRSRVAVDELV